MREIKFRAWDGKEISYDVLQRTDGPEITELNGNIRCCLESDYKSLMQYTGLKDKNGKEIYEFDCLRHFNGTIGVVEYDKVGFTVIEKREDGRKIWNALNDDQWEIIGNIYQNPELIK